MLKREIIIRHPQGLHAQACARLVQTLSAFKSQAKLAARGREIDAKSIMGVMMLAAVQGTHVTLRIHGEDEQAAMQAALALFERDFAESGPETG